MTPARYFRTEKKVPEGFVLHIPLAEAMLCAEVDCGAVFRVEHSQCPSCGSGSFISLAQMQVKAQQALRDKDDENEVLRQTVDNLTRQITELKAEEWVR